jgi:hypothetical protein
MLKPYPSIRSYPLPPATSSIYPIADAMSSTAHTTSTSFNFEVYFKAALAEYTNQTGKDLLKHPLASKINACDNAEAILAIFQEQAKTFHEFRNGDHKLIKWLQPVVDGLHTLSVSAAFSAGISLVSPSGFLRC